MSKLADYGTVLMTLMAREPEAVHSAASLAARLPIGAATVSKILKILAREGLVVSIRGAQGGYRLPHPPSRITVAQVIRALDGPIGMTECSSVPGLCSQEKRCTVRANWVRVNEIVMDVLDGITLEQMTRPVHGAVKVEAIRGRRPRVTAGQENTP
ncbi:MAG TPA: SUF system Fe-S cluster assembly regulator [Usitatibacter sp.]|nr:SUF system Fe-S cluster assembly regulator [Usitatibacter sp.]